ncbi:MAG: hypothetical protein JKY65_21605 [Planctomycetes bacterium]|nr:hypothetical protein [Planctomycetota bacterium]
MTRVVSAGTPTAYRVSQELVESYRARGFSVELVPGAAPEEGESTLIEGQLTNAEGTKISATVRLTAGIPVDGLSQTEVDVFLAGHVVLGGMQGMLANASTVRRIARDKLAGYLDSVLAGVPPESAPEADAPAPEVVEAPAPEAVDAPAPEVVEAPAPNPSRGQSSPRRPRPRPSRGQSSPRTRRRPRWTQRVESVRPQPQPTTQ